MMNGKTEEQQNLQKSVMTQKICHSSQEEPSNSEIYERTYGGFRLRDLFEKQMNYQISVLRKTPEKECFDFPQDNPKWFSYHIQAMIEEMGEVMKADKRWKTHRNTRYEPEEKLDEIADLFITVMNIAMYSNIDAETLGKAVFNKIEENTGKL